MSASAKVIPCDDPTCLMSLSAEAWFRTMARTLRFELRTPFTAATPMLPVLPTTKTVSVSDDDMVGYLEAILNS